MPMLRQTAVNLIFVAGMVVATPSIAGTAEAAAAEDVAMAGTPVYRDRDPAALGLHTRPGSRNKLRHAVERTLKKDPQNVAALSQRGYWHAEEGEDELARQDYDAAMAASADNPANRARVHWSRGWSRYGRGDIAGAIDDWHQAEVLHGGKPYWVPYTYAVAYWTLGDRDRALVWYDVAVASNARWGEKSDMKKLTSHWRDGEKQQLHALFAAWQGSREQASAAAH